MGAMDAAALTQFLADEFPQAGALGFEIAALSDEALTLSLDAGEAHLRPGGTVSGPTLMTLADAAAYLLILSRCGPVALAVTTHLSMHFVRRPRVGPVWATATFLKLGRRLAVCAVHVTGPALDGPLLAHATVTYALPVGPPPADQVGASR